MKEREREFGTNLEYEDEIIDVTSRFYHGLKYKMSHTTELCETKIINSSKTLIYFFFCTLTDCSISKYPMTKPPCRKLRLRRIPQKERDMACGSTQKTSCFCAHWKNDSEKDRLLNKSCNTGTSSGFFSCKTGTAGLGTINCNELPSDKRHPRAEP